MASSRLADKAILIAIGNAIQNLGIAAVGIFLVRIFDDRETYGAYKKVWLVVHSTMPIFLAGYPQSVYFFVPGLAPGQRWTFMWRGLTFLFAVSLFFSVVMYLGADWIAAFLKEPGIADTIRMFALYPAFTAPAMMLFPFMVSVDRHQLAVALNVGFFVTQSTFIVVLAATGASLDTMFGTLVFLAAARLLISYTEPRRLTRGVPSERLGVSIRMTLAYAIPLALSSVATVMGQRIDKLVVGSKLSTDIYAVYDVGAVEFPGIVLVTMAATSVMLPHMSRLFHASRLDELYRFWRESYRKLSLVTIPMLVYLLFFSTEFMAFLYTERFADSAHIFRFYLVVAIFRSGNPGSILVATNRTRWVLWGTICFLAINLVLNLILIGPMGVTGPALATVVAMCALMLYYSVQASRVLGVSVRAMLPVELVLRPLLASALAGLAALPVRQLEQGRFVTLALAALVFAVIYVLAGALLRAIRRSDFELALRWVTLKGFRG